MSLSIIRAVLVTQLTTWANAQTPPIPIAKEGVPFPTPPSTQKPDIFLEPFIIPANTNNVTVSGDRQRFLGTFQINVWVKDNFGTGQAESIAASLSTLFSPVPKTLLPVSVETPLTAHRATSDGAGFRIIPCTLSYRLEA